MSGINVALIPLSVPIKWMTNMSEQMMAGCQPMQMARPGKMVHPPLKVESK